MSAHNIANSIIQYRDKSIFTSDGSPETLWRIFNAVSFLGECVSSDGNTSGGIVSVELDSSTDAFSDGFDFSTELAVVTFETVSLSDEIVETISVDFASSDSGSWAAAAADKNTENRNKILYFIVVCWHYHTSDKKNNEKQLFVIWNMTRG